MKMGIYFSEEIYYYSGVFMKRGRLAILIPMLVLIFSSCCKSYDLSASKQIDLATLDEQEEKTLYSTQSYEQVQAYSPLFVFYDVAVKNSVERFFNRSISELTQMDFDLLAGLYSFRIDAHSTSLTSLRDLPELFPELRHIAFSGAVEDVDFAILREMPSLRAVEISTNSVISFDFVIGLPYVSLSGYRNNLAEASVLGRDFIESQMLGHVTGYVRVVINDERVYELITTDYIYGSWDELHEAKVFVSEKKEGEYYLLQVLDVPGRIGNAFGGLIIADVNFDGQRDILVLQGQFGNQGAATFACFIYDNGVYKLNESFSEIPNPAIDNKNSRILSTWRNWAASHSWAMFSYIDGEFIRTNMLTTSPEEWGIRGEGELNYPIYVWRYEVEFMYNGNIETEIYFTSDFTDDELFYYFFDENSFWGLSSDRWRTLFNRGMLFDWSLYASGLDAQIIEVIN